jgi:isoleucyl-tRNA synthetase
LELQRKNIGRLHNVLAMYEMFANGTAAKADSAHVLDRWVLARLNQLIAESTAGYKNYELDKATRPVTDFIDDLSVWYLRRSRDRLKGDDAADKAAALATLRFVLRELAKVMAPAMPFYAEYLYRAVRADDEPESVHLTAWPEVGEMQATLLETMAETRAVVTTALEARTKFGLKVRQPIASVTGPEIIPSLQQVVLDELNAKAYQVGMEVAIDTALTDELRAEGAIRELMRAVQDARKQAGLAPQDRVELLVFTTVPGYDAINAHYELIKSTVGAATVTASTDEAVVANQSTSTVTAGDFTFSFVCKSI